MTTRETGIEQRLARDNPALTIVFLVAITLLAALGLSRLTIDTNAHALMFWDTPTHQAYLQVSRDFGSDRRAYLYLREENPWTPGKLAALERIHDELRRLPFVERVDDLFSIPAIHGEEGQLNVQPILTRAPAEDQGAENTRDIALGTPLAGRNIVSADGKSLAIAVSIKEGRLGADGEKVYLSLEQVIESARKDLPSLIQLGPQRLQMDTRLETLRQLTWLGSLTALLITLAVLFVHRSLRIAVTALVAGGLAVTWTLGLMGWAGRPLSYLSVILPPLILVLSTSSILQPRLTSAQDDEQEMGMSPLGGARVVTLLVLFAGFGGLVLARVPILQNLAFAAMLGLLVSLIIGALLPPLAHRLMGPASGLPPPGFAAPLSRLAVEVAGWLSHRTMQVALLSAIATLGAALFAGPGFRMAHDALSVFSDNHPVARATTRLHEEIAGTEMFYITLESNAEGAFRDPENLQRLMDIQTFISKQEIFDRSLSLADLVAQANQEAAGGRADAYQTPPTRKLVGQYLLQYRPQDLEPYVSHNFRRATIVVRHQVRDAALLHRHLDEMKSAVAHHAGPAMTTALAGQGILVNAGAERVVTWSITTLLGLAGLVLVAMSVMFTSLRGGLAATLLGAIPALGILVTAQWFNLPVSTATAILLMVVITVTLHGSSRLFARYSERCRNTDRSDLAAYGALEAEMLPMVALSLGLLSAFVSLLFSSFEPVRQFAALACLGLILSGMVNILVMPLVLSRIRLVGLYEILAMSMQREALEKSPLFAGLNNYQIRKAILISELFQFKAGESLIKQNSLERSMYVVVSGSVEVVRTGENGEQRLAILGPGEVFGEIGYVSETYRTAHVRALAPVAVLRFDHERMKKDLMLFPHIMAKLNFNISGILGKRLAEFVKAGQS